MATASRHLHVRGVLPSFVVLQVGVGIKKHICRDTCSKLYDACAQVSWGPAVQQCLATHSCLLVGCCRVLVMMGESVTQVIHASDEVCAAPC